MDGTNSGGDDPLAPLPTDTNSPHSANSEPTPPPTGIVDRRQWEEDRAALLQLMQKIDNISIPEDDDQPRTMIVRFLKSYILGDGHILPAGAVTRIEEESALEMLERWPERIKCATEEELREYDAHKAELDQNEVAGQAVPLADAPDVPAPPKIVRFLDSGNGMINGRPIRRGTIAEIEEAHAWDLYKWRQPGTPTDLPGKIQWATIAELRRYDAIMLEIDKNEAATALDPLSQQLGLAPPETPKLIVRFLHPGIASDDRSCGVGEVWPVEKELAVRHLLETEPVVELATPEELRRDRVTIDHSEGQSKSQVDARRTHRFKNGVPHSGPSTQIVRFLTPGRFAIHVKQGIVYEKRADGCETLPCAAGEIWEVEQDFAYRLLRGKSPIGTLATEAEWEAYRATFTGEPVAVEPAEQSQTQPARLVLDVVPAPVAVGPAEQGQTGAGGKTVKPKNSTAKGDARAKLISALTSHHQYSNGGCGEFQPIGVNELARQAKVAVSTASKFFTREFHGHKNYQRGCGESSTLIPALKLLNDEFTPAILMQRADRKQSDPDEK